MLDQFQLTGGESKIVSSVYPTLLVVPNTLLTAIAAIPTNKMADHTKQILSVPLLLAIFFIPFHFSVGNKVLDLIASLINYNTCLRYSEIFWIRPVVYQKPVYVSLETLWTEFWSCLRIFPDKDTKQTYPKDKKFYHILSYLCVHFLVTDILTNWATSFTGQEVMIMRHEKPVTYFVFYIVCIIVLNSAFNTIGYTLQLFYCVCFEGGSYASEQWRPMMRNPILSHSLQDLWSDRWHWLFKSTWLTMPFRPTRIITMRLLTKRVKHPKPIAFVAAFLSVFAASAFMHEYVVATNVGWHTYSTKFKGEQCVFFIGHGLGVLFEQMVCRMIVPKLPKKLQESSWMSVLGHIWTALFGFFTFHYIAHGFLSWGFQFDNPFQFTKPFVREYVYSHPALLAHFGSHFT
ncbi:hypothetical protein EDC96DRAFT_508989 [Choanephora cucurbitarum]|nr:hypothetical protein EDC96DRAFT_508989 [Choanephora cucurbitarum]